MCVFVCVWACVSNVNLSDGIDCYFIEDEDRYRQCYFALASFMAVLYNVMITHLSE